MAVTIYRAATNQSAALRASLRGPRPIRGAGRDPCLRVVQRRGHVTLGKGMPTWTRGKDGTRLRSHGSDEASSSARRLPGPHTVGRAARPGFSRWARPETRPGINRAFCDPAELETRGFRRRAAALRPSAMLSAAPRLRARQSALSAFAGRSFSRGEFSSPSAHGRVVRAAVFPQRLASVVRWEKYEAPLQHVRDGLTAAHILYISKGDYLSSLDRS